MDKPRKAIRVLLTASGSGKVQEVSIVRNTALDIYQTAPDEAIEFPFALNSGEELTVTLRPAGSPSAETFAEDAAKTDYRSS